MADRAPIDPAHARINQAPFAGANHAFPKPPFRLRWKFELVGAAAERAFRSARRERPVSALRDTSEHVRLSEKWIIRYRSESTTARRKNRTFRWPTSISYISSAAS